MYSWGVRGGISSIESNLVIMKNISKTERKKRNRIKKERSIVQGFKALWSRLDKSEMIEVPYPKEVGETEIQASLWSVLKRHGVDIRLEVRHMVQPKSGVARKQYSRFDCVVYKNKVAVCIIEVKTSGKKRRTGAFKKQAKKYSQYNAHLIYCYGDVEKVVKQVLKLLNLN